MNAPSITIGVRLTLAALAIGLLVCADVPAGGASAERQVMTGTYRWDLGSTKPGTLRAEFEPVRSTGGHEVSQWKVAFRFRFNGRNRTFRGTAEGDLVAGPLRGVVSEGRRTWEFETALEGGALRGTHAERKRNGKLYPSGSLLLRTR